MMWDYWICLYTQTHCVARGLRPLTIKAYRSTLGQFQAYVRVRLDDLSPDRITARHVLEYLEHLRRERDNGDSAVNRQATVLKNFYRAIVAMGHLDPSANPMAHFPRIKASARKMPRVLSHEQVRKLLSHPGTDTILGLRDRALLAVLYGTGIRASECATMTEGDVDLVEATIRVCGKGGHERTLPLNRSVADALRVYREARGAVVSTEAFFLSRSKRGLSRNAIYERVRSHAERARVGQRVSPHRLRHSFATHLVQRGVGLVTIRDLLGHRLITSTQIYLHVTADELRDAADRHPILQLAAPVDHLLPKVRLPFQPPPGRRRGCG
jgi:site-specific recombinase XerD